MKIIGGLTQGNGGGHYENMYNDWNRLLIDGARLITKDEAAAEDIVMEVFKKTWDLWRKNQLSKKKLNIAYLRKAVNNGCNTWWADQQRRRLLNKEMSDRPAEENNANEPRQKYMQLAIQLIEGLPKQQRRVMRAILIDGMSLDEIAVALDLDKQTVYRHKGMAKVALKRMIEEKRIRPRLLVWWTIVYLYSLIQK